MFVSGCPLPPLGGRAGGLGGEGDFAICSYLFGLGGDDVAGALATGFCDLSTITLALGWHDEDTGLGDGAFAIGITSLVWVAVESPAQRIEAAAILERGYQPLFVETAASHWVWLVVSVF